MSTPDLFALPLVELPAPPPGLPPIAPILVASAEEEREMKRRIDAPNKRWAA